MLSRIGTLRNWFVLLLASLLSVFTYDAKAQATWDEFSEYFINTSDEIEDENSSDLHYSTEEYLEQLEELQNARINFNIATRDELLVLPFLSEEKVDSILAYRARKGGFLSFGELMFIAQLTYNDRRFIPLFFDCTPIASGDTVRLGEKFWKGRHTFSTRFDVPLYRRAGYAPDKTPTATNYYFGKPFANVVRYRYAYRQQIAYGFTLQQDEGEPFAKHKNYPYDYMSAYFQFVSQSGHLEWILGDYRLSAGQGLLLGNNFFSSRAMLVESSFRESRIFTKNTGCNEINFFRGGAIKWNLKNWNFSAFASYRRIDAIVKNDTITSFQTTGYHRTLSENQRKGNVGALLVGADIRTHIGTWQLGLTAYYAHYDRTVFPKLKEYNRYYLRGQNAGGISFSYQKHGKRWSWQGEGAMDGGFHFAMTNSLQLRPRSETMKYLIQLRNFSPRFVAPYASTLAAGSRISNEHALLLGTHITALPHTTFTLYTEACLFPRPKYLVSKRSARYEVYAKAQHRFKTDRLWLLSLQYRLRGTQKDVSGYDDIIEFKHSNSGKISLEYIGNSWNILMAVNGNYSISQTRKEAKGWAISVRSKYSFARMFRASAFLAYFDTDDYASRIYIYEPQLKYAAGFPTLYYQGIRGVATVNLNIRHWGELAFRYAITHYLDRNKISSGTQLIDSPTKQDISIHFLFRL